MMGCIFCGRTVKRAISLGLIFSFHEVKRSLLCQKCADRFEEIDAETACPGCFRKQETAEMCADCVRWQETYSTMAPKHRALYAYNEAARAYMNQFKFQGDLLLAKIFSEVLYEALKPYQKTHLLVPIPASSASKKTRGFNQVELLLEEAGISYATPLVHMGNEKKQSSKDRKERMFSKQSFQLKETIALEKPVLIVDDVYTTGRTIFHAREILEKYTTTASFSLFR